RADRCGFRLHRAFHRPHRRLLERPRQCRRHRRQRSCLGRHLFRLRPAVACGSRCAHRHRCRLCRRPCRRGRSGGRMTIDPTTLTAILAMAVITYLTRIAGIFLVGRLALSGRAKAAFDAIPPAVLVAVIAPTALATGWPETLAALVTAVAATRLPLLATIAVGVASVVLLRMLAG